MAFELLPSFLLCCCSQAKYLFQDLHLAACFEKGKAVPKCLVIETLFGVGYPNL